MIDVIVTPVDDVMKPMMVGPAFGLIALYRIFDRQALKIFLHKHVLD